MKTAIYGLQTRDGGWIAADSGNPFKTDKRHVAEAAAEKLRESGGMGVVVARYDLRFATVEDLAKRLEAAEVALEDAREFASGFVDGAPDASIAAKAAAHVVQGCSIALGHARAML